ncbi:hypothetical protein QBC43DRAFT_315285 [Cladorrhinum sp. PSN259]|nr:hypothetical protein QBC43DRAFT_315285 [Cladorrhinum sp. PSN259]
MLTLFLALCRESSLLLASQGRVLAQQWKLCRVGVALSCLPTIKKGNIGIDERAAWELGPWPTESQQPSWDGQKRYRILRITKGVCSDLG